MSNCIVQEARRFAPKTRDIREESLSGLSLLRELTRDVVGVWPREAYRQSSCELTLFFGRKIFLFNDPESVRRILVDESADFPRSVLRNRLIAPVVGEGLVLAEGDEWRKQRRMLAPAFTPRNVDHLAPLMADGAAQHVAELGDSAQQIDLFKTVARWTLEIVTKAMLSLDVSEESRRLKGMSDFYLAHLAIPRALDVLTPAWAPTPFDIARKLYGLRWRNFIQSIVDRRLAKKPPEQAEDLLDLIRIALDDGSNPALLRHKLRDQIATMVAGANETTSLGISWTLYLIAQDSALQEALREEVGVRKAGEATFATGPLLRATFAESLRLFPPNFAVMRRAAKDCLVDGRKVAAGSTVMVMPWIIHRHEAYWSDPDVFDISRFLPDAPPPGKYAYIPYSVGPRICIGATFANILSAQVIAALLARYRVELAEPPEAMPNCIALARADRPVPVRLSPI